MMVMASFWTRWPVLLIGSILASEGMVELTHQGGWYAVGVGLGLILEGFFARTGWLRKRPVA